MAIEKFLSSIVVDGTISKVGGTSAQFLKANGSIDSTVYTTNLGTVTSVSMTVPTGLSISGSPITTSGTLALSLTAGYSIPTTTNQTNWGTAFTQTLQWNGGATNLVAATGRTSLGGTTIGQSMFTLVNPSAITFPQFNANNTVSALTAAAFRTAIGAGTSSTIGTVTSVIAGNGMTQSGTSTINPTLDIVSHIGSAGTIGTINIGADAIGVNLGTTSITACAGNDSRLSDARTPTAGSTNYIQNQNTSAQSANMWISGNGTFAGALTAASYNGVIITSPTATSKVINAFADILDITAGTTYLRIDDAGSMMSTNTEFSATALYGDGYGLTGTASGLSIGGNASTATNLSTDRNNWSTNGTISAVVGQLSWKNYNNNHTIFDASAGTSPTGTTVNTSNPSVAWAPTYPTLMGFNGTQTYGVRVDSARISDTSSGLNGQAASFYKQQVTYSSTAGAKWMRIAKVPSGTTGNFYCKIDITNAFINNPPHPISLYFSGNYRNASQVIQLSGTNGIFTEARLVYPVNSDSEYYLEVFCNATLSNSYTFTLSDFFQVSLYDVATDGSIPVNYSYMNRVTIYRGSYLSNIKAQGDITAAGVVTSTLLTCLTTGYFAGTSPSDGVMVGELGIIGSSDVGMACTNGDQVIAGYDVATDYYAYSGSLINSSAGILEHAIIGKVYNNKPATYGTTITGEIVKYGTGTTVAGRLYYLNTSLVWTEADADLASSSSSMLGIAVGTNPATNGMLVRGSAKFSALASYTAMTAGQILYVSMTAGEFTATPPTGTGKIVRIIGYCVDAATDTMYFCPDNTWIELT